MSEILQEWQRVDLMLGFIVAMSVTMALIPPLIQVAARWRVLDQPAARKVHTVPVPRVGGMAMAAGILLALAVGGSLGERFAQPMPAFVAGVLVLLVFGVVDDRYNLSAGAKLVGQVAAVLIAMVWGDVSVDSITLAERYVLPEWLALPLTLFFLLGTTNAINLADGLDGLAGGMSLLCLCALAMLAFAAGNGFVTIVAIVFAGAILGFLRFNTHPARVFMGDGGSQILGFSVAVLAVELTQDRQVPLSSALPLLLLGLPIIDTLTVMTRRLLAGHSPFHADRTHFHHRLLGLGFDHREAVVLIYLLQALLFLAAWFMRYESDLAIVVVFTLFAAALVIGPEVAQARGWQRPAATLGLRRRVRARVRELLIRWAYVALAVLTSSYFLAIAAAAPPSADDVRWFFVGLAASIVTCLALRRCASEPSAIDKSALYVCAVAAVYLDSKAVTLFEVVPWMRAELAVFVVIIVAIIARSRLSQEHALRVTPLDILIVFIAAVVPNLPGAIAPPWFFGGSIAKLVVLFYAIETLLLSANRAWRWWSCGAGAFLIVCAAIH